MTRPAFGPGAWITDAWTYRGFPAIVLENGAIRMTVLPGHGAKVVEFISMAADRDLLYHHPRLDVRPPVFGANVDDWWTGGIDEVAPTGIPRSSAGSSCRSSASSGRRRGPAGSSTRVPTPSRSS